MLELIVVVIVVGLIAALATAKMVRSSANLQSVSEMIAADLRELQALAMSQGEVVTAVFSGSGYRAYRGGEEVQDTRFPQDISALRSRIVNPQSVAFDTSGAPLGEAGYSVTVQSDDGEEGATINMERYTGYVTVE